MFGVLKNKMLFSDCQKGKESSIYKLTPKNHYFCQHFWKQIIESHSSPKNNDNPRDSHKWIFSIEVHFLCIIANKHFRMQVFIFVSPHGVLLVKRCNFYVQNFSEIFCHQKENKLVEFCDEQLSNRSSCEPKKRTGGQ